MNFNAEGEAHQEIVIVRRGGQDAEEAHHGGVWKIAFADFMTAMMCFFLVMWLINAANEQTKAAVASYFNPVKLIDRNTSRKGLDEPGKAPGDPDVSTAREEHNTDKPVAYRDAQTGPAKNENSLDLANTQKHSDKNLFADPYSVLSEIAGETGVLQNTSAKGDGGSQKSGPATGASGGQSYRDPFAPDFWAQQVVAREDAKAPGQSGPGERPAEKSVPARTSDEADAAAAANEMVAAAEASTRAGLGATAGEEASGAAKSGESASGKLQPGESRADGGKPGDAAREPGKSGDQPAGRQSAGDLTSGARKPGPQAGAPRPEEAKAATPGAPEAASAEAKAAIDKEAADIRKQLAGTFNSGEPLYHGLTVTETDKGVLISVSDQADFAMFEIGSAVPKRDTVLAMEKIARILATHKGDILIDGHTDGRPFRTEAYDNWRLSSARAQSAYYMLVRAGVAEKRVVEVAGFADRKLKVKDDPYADANRRIEILLEPK